MSDHPHFRIVSYGCGYYAVHTRADVYGASVPIHEPEVPDWGTLWHRCCAIMAAAEPSPELLRELRVKRAAAVGASAASCARHGLAWNAAYLARQAARWAECALSGDLTPACPQMCSAT